MTNDRAYTLTDIMIRSLNTLVQINYLVPILFQWFVIGKLLFFQH